MKVQTRVTRILTLFAIASLAAILAQPIALAVPSPTPDEGPIRDVEIRVAGYWFWRPDSRIDGLPQTASTGPFKVRAQIVPDSGVASVELYHQVGASNWSKAQMTIDGLVVSGTIPRRQVQTIGGWLLHFYLRAYDAAGTLVWTDEIPTPEGGDPYNIYIVIPAPFEGVWERKEHKPTDTRLHIRRIRSTSSDVGDIFQYGVTYVGPQGEHGLSITADLLRPEYMETATHSYEYDRETGELYVWGETDNGVYIKVKEKR